MNKEFELVIDPGHGGSDPGAVSKNGHEKDYTLLVSLYQYKRFKELGVKVGLTRNDDYSLTTEKRTSLAQKGLFCISNHLNGGGGDRAEVIHSIYADGVLAKKIEKEFLKVGQDSVRIYTRKGSNGDYYYMHRETGSTKTNIVEYCFIDNDKDFAHFKANWKEYAEAVIRAFCEHIGRKYEAPKVDENKFYRVVTGSFTNKENALERVEQLKSRGFESFIDVYSK